MQNLYEHFRLDVCYKEYFKDRVEINASLTIHFMFKSNMEFLLNDSIQRKATPEFEPRCTVQGSTLHDQQMLP